jgi:hypothetical protein
LYVFIPARLCLCALRVEAQGAQHEQLDAPASGLCSVEAAGDDAGLVEDEQVAGAQVRAQLAEDSVVDTIRRAASRGVTGAWAMRESSRV